MLLGIYPFPIFKRQYKAYKLLTGTFYRKMYVFWFLVLSCVPMPQLQLYQQKDYLLQAIWSYSSLLVWWRYHPSSLLAKVPVNLPAFSN